MSAYTLKVVGLPSGKMRIWLQCPRCGNWGIIDGDQLRGRVSAECATQGCEFHETVDFLPHLGPEDRARAEAGEVEG